MKILVTGATGLVGRHAAERLKAAGHSVRVLARDPQKAERCLGPLGIGPEDVVVGDMTDRRAVAEALHAIDAVVHAAATVSVTVAGAADAFDGNVVGTEMIVGGAIDHGIERIVFVSSAAAIFDPHAEQITADSPLAESRTRYGRSKAAADRFVRKLQRGGAPIATVYPSGVIGPDDPGLSESVRAYRGFLRGTLKTSGGTQFVDARDLAKVLAGLIETGAAGRHAAVGPFYTWDELTALLDRTLGTKIPRIRVPGALMRGAGHIADWIGRATGREMPLSAEALTIATLWRPIPDTPSIRELGVEWRAPEETIADMFAWFVRTGRLPASAVPGLKLTDSEAPTAAAKENHA